MKKKKEEKEKRKKTEGKSYNNKQRVGEWVSERDLATIGLTTKDPPETTNSTELAHPREIGLTRSVIQLKELTDNSDLGVTTATATHDNDDNAKKAKNQQVNNKQF